MKTTGQRIKDKRKEHGYTQQQLAKLVGVSGTSVVYWERDETKPSGKYLLKLAKALKVSPDHILNGKDEEVMFMLSKKTDSSVRENMAEYLAKLEVPPALSAKVPLISTVQAGQWSAIVDDFQPGDADIWVNTTAKVGKSAFALRVEGDSMTNPHGLPSIPEGMTVIVDPDIEPTNGKIVVARLESEAEATIKKLVLDGPNKYLMPLNPRYDKITINGDCTIVGVVVKMEYDLI